MAEIDDDAISEAEAESADSEQSDDEKERRKAERARVRAERKAERDADRAAKAPVWKWKGEPGSWVPGIPNRDLTRSEVEAWVGHRAAAESFASSGLWDVDQEHLATLPVVQVAKQG